MTREEAINVLQKYTDTDSGISKVVAKAHKMAIIALEQEKEYVTRAEESWERANELIEKLIEQEPKIEWIPVSERLPEEKKAVLVYAPERNNIYCAYLEGDTWFIFGGYGSYAVANVIAWQPLPYPYKESKVSE